MLIPEYPNDVVAGSQYGFQLTFEGGVPFRFPLADGTTRDITVTVQYGVGDTVQGAFDSTAPGGPGSGPYSFSVPPSPAPVTAQIGQWYSLVAIRYSVTHPVIPTSDQTVHFDCRPRGGPFPLGPNVVPADQTAGTAVPTCNGRVATLVGTRWADDLHGTPGADVIVAGDGNDVVFGSGGHDLVCGGGGGDWLLGEWRGDTLDGGDGVDVVVGGPGIDACIGEFLVGC